MTVNELRVKVQQAEDGYDILRLDSEYQGSCPCFQVLGDGFAIDGHCWRTCRTCDGVGLHVSSAVPSDVAKLMARHLTDLDWYGKWPVSRVQPDNWAGVWA